MYTTTLPPSSKTVLEILSNGGAMTHKDLVQKTNLAPRTVRYALKKLKEKQLIIEKFKNKSLIFIMFSVLCEHSRVFVFNQHDFFIMKMFM